MDPQVKRPTQPDHAEAPSADLARATDSRRTRTPILSALGRWLSPAWIIAVSDHSAGGDPVLTTCARYGSTLQPTAGQYPDPDAHVVVVSDRVIFTNIYELPRVAPKEMWQILTHRLRDQFTEIYDDLAWSWTALPGSSTDLLTVTVRCVRQSVVLRLMSDAARNVTHVSVVNEALGWVLWLAAVEPTLLEDRHRGVVLGDGRALLLQMQDGILTQSKSLDLAARSRLDLASVLKQWSGDDDPESAATVVCSRGDASPQEREMGVALASHIGCAFHVAPASIAALHAAAAANQSIAIHPGSSVAHWKSWLPRTALLLLVVMTAVLAPIAADYVTDRHLLDSLRVENAALAVTVRSTDASRHSNGSASDRSSGTTALLGEVLRHVSGDTRLQELHVDHDGVLRLRGNCRTLGSALELADALRASDSFASVELTRMRTLEGDPIHEFEIAAVSSREAGGRP